LGEERWFLLDILLSEALNVVLFSLNGTCATLQYKDRAQFWKEQPASERVCSPAEKKKGIPNFTSFL
jgi:hypothetical protein